MWLRNPGISISNSEFVSEWGYVGEQTAHTYCFLEIISPPSRGSIYPSLSLQVKYLYNTQSSCRKVQNSLTEWAWLHISPCVHMRQLCRYPCLCVLKCLTGKGFALWALTLGSKGLFQLNNSEGRHVKNTQIKFPPTMDPHPQIPHLGVQCALFMRTSKLHYVPMKCWFNSTKRMETFTCNVAFASSCLQFHFKATWD